MSSSNKPLILKLKKSETGAFEQLFKLYSPRLFNFCRKFLNSKEDAEDIVQVVFTAVWENRLRIDEERSFSTYLFTIARNRIINILKKKVYAEGFINYTMYAANGNVNYLTEDTVLFNELQQVLEKSINELPQKRREIFILSRKEGLSYKEIAKKLSISESTVNTQITHAINFLRDKFSYLSEEKRNTDIV